MASQPFRRLIGIGVALLSGLFFLATAAQAQTITSVSPNDGPLLGGRQVTITGTGLQNVTSVTIGSATATIQPGSVTATQIIVTTGSTQTAGAVNVVARNGNTIVAQTNNTPFTYRLLCGGTVSADCLSTFTKNGAAPPATLTASISVSGGNYTVRLSNSGSSELSAALSTGDTVVIGLTPAAGYTPRMVMTTGALDSWTFANGTATITAHARPSSWASTCSTSNCPSTAQFDYNSLLLIAVSNLPVQANAPAIATTFANAMANGFIATNAQFFTFPGYNSNAKAVSFQLGAPTNKTDGVTQNTGFFEAFVPDAVITNSQLWNVSDPQTLTGNNKASAVVGSDTLKPTVTRVTSPNAGLLFQLNNYHYSVPTVALSVSGTISGNIKDAGTNSALSGITVNVVNSSNVFVKSGQSNAQGDYSIGGLDPGTYFVKTTNGASVGSGYVNLAYNSTGNKTCLSNCNPTTGGVGTSLTLDNGDTRSGTDFAMSVGGKISGTVTQDGAGVAISGITVQAYDPAVPNSQVGSATTAANGTYTIGGLPTLAYVLKTSNQLGYLEKLYNNIPCSSCSVAAGNTVGVTVGAETTGINFLLVLGGTIKGKVTNAATTAGVGNLNVQFYNSAGVSVASVNTSNQTATLGEYTSPALPSGTYFSATNGSNTGLINKLYNGIDCLGCTAKVNGVSGALNGTPITVAAGSPTTGINFALATGLSISGQVTDRGTAAPVSNVRVLLYTEASGSSSLTSATTDSSGNYSITGLPAGTYFVRTNGFASGTTTFTYINQVFKTGGSVNCGSCKPSEFGTGVTITAGTGSASWGPVAQVSATGINLSLPAGGSVTGTVTSSGSGVSGATVGAYDANNNGAFVSSTSTAASGTYTINGLTTGNYYVKVTPTAASGLIGQVANGKICLNCNASTGDKIAVTAGGSAVTVNFSLNSGGTITGTIKSSASGNPVVSGISVTLATATSSNVTSTSTNSSGVFTLAGLPADTYFLRTSNSQGFLDKLYDNLPCVNCSSASASGTPIVLTVGATKTADFTLTPGSKISGVVTDLGTGEPIPGITVNIYNSAGSFLTSGTANDAGAWITQAGLAGGTYFAKTSVGTSSGIYINKLYNNIICTNCPASSGTPITVVLGTNVTNINFALAAGGRVTGTVLDASNNPVSGVTVNVYSSQKDPQTNSTVFLGSGFTGANGAYAVAGLPGGSVVARTSNSLGFIDEVYDDITCLNCSVLIGKPFTVAVGATTSGIDFKLAAGARITGTIVSSASGNPPIPNVSVSVFSDTSGTSSLGSASTNSSGVFTSGGLPPGKYYIKTTNANNSGFVNQLFSGLPCTNCQANSGTAITLAAGQLATASFTLSAGASISGTVTEGASTNEMGIADAVGGPVSGISINLYDSGNTFITSVQSGADGTFTLRGLAAGTYFAKTSNSQGFIDRLYDNVTCTSCAANGGKGIAVTGTGTVTGINFSMVRGGSIGGTITDASAAPLSDVKVSLYGASGQFLKSTTSGGTGGYSLAGLPNGTYYVRTSNSLGYIDELYNDLPCASCSILTGAQIKVTSAAPNVANIDFSLAVGGLITGTISAAGGGALENIGVSVFTSSGGSAVANGYTNASGVYKTGALPTGTYFVRTNNSKGFIDQVYDGKPCTFCNPTTGTGVAVTIGQTTSNINFTLTAGGRVSGAVTSGGAAVANANVTIYNSAGTGVTNGTTDGTGSYTTFGGLPTGTYYARTFNNAGLVDEIYDDITCASCNATTGKPISVVSGQTTGGVTFALVAGSRVAGTVTDKGTGNPLANARVDVYASNGRFVTSATAGTNGGYITNGGLSAGTYYVRGTATQGAYISKMYNDVDCPSCAPFKGTPVVVAANETKTGIDFALSQGGLISGQVSDATTGAPVGSTEDGFVGVNIYNGSNQLIAGATVDASGRFATYSGLPSGIYYVRTVNNLGYINKLYNKTTPCLGDSGGGKAASGSGGGGINAPACVPNTGTAVSVTTGQTASGVNFSMALGIRIGGTIVDAATNQPIANANVTVFDSTGKQVTGGSTDNAGKYLTFGGLPPGTYYASAGAAEQGYYRKLYNDLLCLACNPTLGQAIQVVQTKTDVNFSLAKGGSFSGSVKKASTGAPLANLNLSLYSSTGSLISSGTTDADGKFKTIGLPPGSYFIRTFNLLGLVDQSYLNRACAPCPIESATPIVVAANATTAGIDFSLATGGLVHGYITDQTSGAALQGVTVAFYLPDNTTFVGRSGATDESGYYAISLPVGTYIPRPDPIQGYTPVATLSPIGNGVNGQISTVGVTEDGDSEVAITMDACLAPAVSPATMPNLSLGVPFSITLTAAGGNGPFTFSLADGSLPPGLTLNASTGVISGTPTTRGTANFTIGATGSGNCAGTTSYAQVTIGVTLSAASADVSSSASSGTLALVAEASGLTWTATSNASWLTLTPSSGTGSATLTYTIAANTGAARTGAITVSGETFTVNQARSNRPRIALDGPREGQALARSFVVSGWALDLDASDVGVDAVQVYAYPVVNGVLDTPTFLGSASTTARGDVAALYGSQFVNSGFSLSVSGLPVGSYRIVVYARTTLTGLFDATQSANVTVSAAGSTPAMSLDGPAANATVGDSFVVTGWAIDRGASSDAGVDAVRVFAYPIVSGVLGSATLVGEATLSGARPDVAAVFGSQFTNSGFSLTGSGLSAGRYRLAAFARSTVTGTFNQSAAVDVTVDVPVPNPVLFIDGPASGSTQTQPFLLAGWAVDRGARSGTGVDFVHVWALNVDTGDTRFVGAASYGGTRGDVGAAFGTQFTNSGYSVSVADLPAGRYDVVVYLHSSVSGTFSLVKSVRVTVQ